MTASVAIQVRDGIVTRLQAAQFFTQVTFTFTKNRALQIQPETLPLCGVYFISETHTPEGDPNAGEPRFRTTARYGLSVLVVNNDMEAAEYVLDLAAQAIATALFTDPTFYYNSSFKIQSFNFGTRSHSFGSAGLDNETPFAELKWELICDLGTDTYPPLVLDDLDLIHVKTAFPLGGTPEEQAAVQQVEAEYDLPQN